MAAHPNKIIPAVGCRAEHEIGFARQSLVRIVHDFRCYAGTVGTDKHNAARSPLERVAERPFHPFTDIAVALNPIFDIGAEPFAHKQLVTAFISNFDRHGTVLDKPSHTVNDMFGHPALQVSGALRAEGVGCTTRGKNPPPDWHIYSYMFAITTKSGTTKEGCPFACPTYRAKGGNVNYARGDCPVADDLFDRVLTVSLNQWFSAKDCRNIAGALNKVLSAYCTPDPGATKWL